MPVRNADPYLSDCLNSIIAQSESNWELIAINDHSTDNSASILNNFSKKDKRIFCFNNSGKGIIDALDLAFSKSTGKMITRMDADDLMLPNKLEILKDLCNSDRQVISTAKVQYISDDQLGEGYLKYEEWLNQLIDHDSHYKEIYKECVLPSPNWMMKRETLEFIGGFENLNYPEDYDLCFKAYELNIPIIGSDQVTHQWRDYPERTSRNDPNYADNRFTALKIRYFLKNDLNGEDLILWGAGTRGKMAAKNLIKKGVNFKWITNNKKKIGHQIYDHMLEQVPTAFSPDTKIIVTVAAVNAQASISKRLSNHQGVYWFC